MQYRYIYKITCTAGRFKDKFYFGKHTTDNLDDGYKGSGRKLKDYYKKHPNDYIKEIIGFYSSDEELNKAEYDIIEPWLNNNMCLNINIGGRGGKPKGVIPWNKGIHTGKITLGFAGHKHSEETKNIMSDKHKNQTPWNKGKTGCYHPPHSEETKHKISESKKIYYKRKREQELSCSL